MVLKILKTVVFMCLLFLVIITDYIVIAQHGGYTTPVPILKQINKHNEDGSYSYGYEAADGTFKIETKYPTGEVYGKYGYVDESGKLREVEYGASKRGFEPQGNDINVPPPTLRNDNPNLGPLGPNEIDDGQYREDPSVYYKNEKYNKRPNIPASNFRLDNLNNQQSRPNYAPPPQPPQPYNNYNLAPQPAHNYNNYNPSPAPIPPPQPHRYQQPSYQQPSYQQPNYQQNSYPYNSVPTHHHPALQNLDIWSGSYSISYTGR